MTQNGGDPPQLPKAPGLSFGGFKGRAKPKLAVSEAEQAKRREAITGIGAAGVITANGAPAAAGPRIIPKQQDSFVVGVGRNTQQPQPDAEGRQGRPRFIPDHDDGTVGTVDEKFEVAEEAAADTSIVYGLNLQPKRDRGGDDVPESAAARAAGGGEAAQQNGGGGSGSVTSREWEAKQFKEDVARLPAEADAAAYEAMPIEEFGAAMMRGMGWTEGQGVGRRKSGPAKPFQYVQRPHRLGLGAEPAKPEESSKRHIKPGETRAGKEHKVYIDAEGRQRHVMTLDDKLVDRQLLGVNPGKTMHLLSGRHEGLTCEVLALEPKVAARADKATVRLNPSGQAVTVRCSELGEKHEADAQARDKAAAAADKRRRKKEKRDGGNGSGRDGSGRDGSGRDGSGRDGSGRESGRDSGADAAKRRRRDGGDAAERDSQPQTNGAAAALRDTDAVPLPAGCEQGWLLPHIRVRIIDKTLAQGRLYLKKAIVVDVSQPTICDVVVDDPRQRVTGVAQRQLESIVPKANGARVIFLAGGHRGQRAKLLHRNVKAGAAAVQLLADYEIVKVAFDDIAEYVGDAHEEE